MSDNKKITLSVLVEDDNGTTNANTVITETEDMGYEDIHAERVGHFMDFIIQVASVSNTDPEYMAAMFSTAMMSVAESSNANIRLVCGEGKYVDVVMDESDPEYVMIYAEDAVPADGVAEGMVPIGIQGEYDEEDEGVDLDAAGRASITPPHKLH
tara:strand:- start:129236 stop:129700 length:465 start_codon:yes stop_codon:yes gene_type:complete